MKQTNFFDDYPDFLWLSATSLICLSRVRTCVESSCIDLSRVFHSASVSGFGSRSRTSALNVEVWVSNETLHSTRNPICSSSSRSFFTSATRLSWDGPSQYSSIFAFNSYSRKIARILLDPDRCSLVMHNFSDKTGTMSEPHGLPARVRTCLSRACSQAQEGRADGVFGTGPVLFTPTYALLSELSHTSTGARPQ